MIPPNPTTITRIAAVIQKEYGLGPDSASSIVRRVLGMYVAAYADSNAEKEPVKTNPSRQERESTKP